MRNPTDRLSSWGKYEILPQLANVHKLLPPAFTAPIGSEIITVMARFVPDVQAKGIEYTQEHVSV